MNHASVVRSLSISLALLAPLWLGAASCKQKAPPGAGTPAVAVAESASARSSASIVASASASASASARALPDLPVLAFEPLVGTPLPTRVFPIEGALAVTAEARVGKLTDGRVEWLPEQPYPLNAITVTDVHGRWPDRIDILYQAKRGRDTRLFYRPYTGIGVPLEGGDEAHPDPDRFPKAIVSLGETTMVLQWSLGEGETFTTTRGKWKERSRLKASIGYCNLDEQARGNLTSSVVTYALEALPSGSLVALSTVCQVRGPYAEVWDANNVHHLLDLRAWISGVGPAPQILAGDGDEAWIVPGAGGAILRYKDGAVTPLPKFGDAFRAFRGSDGGLHATDGRTVQRLRDGAWAPIGSLPWPVARATFAVEGDRLWASIDEHVYRVRPEGGPKLAFAEGCPTPFVDVRAVRDGEAVGDSFPDVRVALAALPDLSGLKLVEFYELGRRIGVSVTSKAQGEAVVEKLRATGAQSRLLCHAPKAPREIPLPTKG